MRGKEIAYAPRKPLGPHHLGCCPVICGQILQVLIFSSCAPIQHFIITEIFRQVMQITVWSHDYRITMCVCAARGSALCT